MRTGLILAAVICGCVATVLGFGLVDDHDWAEDFAGWFAIAATFFFAAHIPWERWDR